MTVREARATDVEPLADLAHQLWPDDSRDKLREWMKRLMSGERVSTLPLTFFVAELDGRLAGFVEVGLRSHAEGCDMSRPAGFIEGWFVVPERRNRGIGRALISRAETWCRELGCTELGSDTWLDNEPSQRAHLALGFQVVERAVHFRKQL